VTLKYDDDDDDDGDDDDDDDANGDNDDKDSVPFLINSDDNCNDDKDDDGDDDDNDADDMSECTCCTTISIIDFTASSKIDNIKYARFSPLNRCINLPG